MKLTGRSRIPTIRLTAALALLLTLGQACSSGNTAAADDPQKGIEGSWVLIELTAAPEIDIEAGERKPTLEVRAEGVVTGFSGVNQFNGQFDPVALEQGQLQAAPMISTRMAGPEVAMEFEREFLQILAAADGFHIDGGELVLTQSGQPVARFDPTR